MIEEPYGKKIEEYLTKNLAKGYNINALKWALIEQGYSKVAVEKAIRNVKEKMSKNEEKIVKPNTISVDVVPVESEQKAEIVNSEPENKGFFGKVVDFLFG